MHQNSEELQRYPALESLTAEQRTDADTEIQRVVDLAESEGTDPLSRVRSSGEILREVLPEIDYYVHGYLAPGWVTLLAGFQKYGKSTWVMALAKALENGAPFCGMKTRPSKVVWLTEEPESVIRTKLAKFRIADEQIYFLFWHDNKQLSWEDWIEVALRACEMHEANLLVVDPFAKFARVMDENTPEVGQRVDQISGSVRKGMVSVLLVAHANKNQRIYRGHTSLADVVEVKSSLTKEERAGNNTRRIKSEGRLEENMWTIDVTLEGSSYLSSTTSDQVTARGIMEGLTVSSACAFIEKKGGKVKTAVFVKEHCGGERPRANRTLDLAKERGKLNNPERGWWEIVEPK